MAYDERPGVGRSMSSWKGISTCGLYVRGVLHAAGIRAPELAAPYVPGSVFDRLLSLGRRMNCWVDAAPGLHPEPGDIVFFGLDTPSSGHVGICEEPYVGGLGELRAGGMMGIEAGQVRVRGGWQCVTRKRHTWSPDPANPRKVQDVAIQVPPVNTFAGAARHLSGWIRLAGLASLVAGGCAPDPTPPPSSDGLDVRGAEGIDVSSDNGHIDWVAVAGAGIKWAYYRGCLGLGTPDNLRAENAHGASSAGIAFHAPYHVLFPPRPFSGGKNDAAAQAREYAAAWETCGATADPMLDVEVVRTAKGQEIVANGAQWRDAAELWVATIRGLLGVSPILYSGKWFLDLHPELRASTTLRGLRFWMANYSDPLDAFPMPKGWEDRTLFARQYAGSDPRGRVGRVAGVSTDVDRNVLDAPLRALRSA